MNAVVPLHTPPANVDSYRASTDAAALCKEIVVATASNIQGRKYVCVEGWQAIAVAHGCAASARDVERVEGGVRAIGEVRRMSDGITIAAAEGFVGEDEATWYGGTQRGRTLPKRADYAIRAMAQTRAISRACRSAFAHVVVMMNAGLQTTPAEEVPAGGFEDRDEPAARQTVESRPATQTEADTAKISGEQLSMIQTLASQAGVSAGEINAKAKVGKTSDMPASMFDGCMKWLEQQINARSAQQKPASVGQQASELLDDEIPY